MNLYRELAYDGAVVPYVTKYYKNTIVGYSYSKSLSLPGERIGYLIIPDELEDSENVINAAAIANPRERRSQCSVFDAARDYALCGRADGCLLL